MLLAILVSLGASFAQAREMETDRPDRTDSSVTVDKGRFQLELEAASYKRESGSTDDLSIGAFELRYGVSDRADVEIQAIPFHQDDENSEVGDTTLRLKINIMGREPNETSMAVMPFVKVPTAPHGNGKVEGGLAIPMKIALPNEFELAFEVETAAMRNKENTATVTQFVTSYSLTHGLARNLDGYLEFYSETEPSADWEATVDTGLAYQLNDDNQLDAGVNIGASPAADPLQVFAGYSVRF